MKIEDVMQQPEGEGKQGLIQQATRGTPQQTLDQSTEQLPPEAVDGQTPQDGEVDPKDQEAYDRVVMGGIKALSDKKSNAAIMGLLKQQADNPPQALAEAASVIILQLDERSGGKIPEGVILPAAAEILEEVAEFAQKSKTFTVEQSVVDQATELMITRLAQEYGVDAAETQAFLDGADQQTKDMAEAKGKRAGGNAPAPAPAPAPAQPAGNPHNNPNGGASYG